MFPPFNCLKKYFIYLFLEGGEEREKEREKHSLVASCTSPTRELPCNPSMCPDQKSSLLVHKPCALNSLNHTSQSLAFSFSFLFYSLFLSFFFLSFLSFYNCFYIFVKIGHICVGHFHSSLSLICVSFPPSVPPVLIAVTLERLKIR
ncbi:hypothetical protein HJG60_011315 [Phyllostomus discolor]|uniref:Uncharacterized protein n=1 Tax=Phyllostomus discolor TaxID=89673 RepID=A0A834E5B6_9CHIR|nr:hypothetical protein HJG60_011315 [Phyllostomus discolor]